MPQFMTFYNRTFHHRRSHKLNRRRKHRPHK